MNRINFLLLLRLTQTKFLFKTLNESTLGTSLRLNSNLKNVVPFLTQDNLYILQSINYRIIKCPELAILRLNPRIYFSHLALRESQFFLHRSTNSTFREWGRETR